MANDQHVKILKTGVDTWSEWSKENPNEKPDLTGASLIRVNLGSADIGLGREFEHASREGETMRTGFAMCGMVGLIGNLISGVASVDMSKTKTRTPVT